MGADLYIKNMDRESQYTGFEVSKKAVNAGYFRDPYNSLGLFNFLSSNTSQTFSWWAFVQDKKYKSWFNNEGEMTVSGAKKFRQRLLKAKEELLERDYFERYDWSDKKSEAMVDTDVNEYMAWLELLLDFLKLAIKERSPIIFSV